MFIKKKFVAFLLPIAVAVVMFASQSFVFVGVAYYESYNIDTLGVVTSSYYEDLTSQVTRLRWSEAPDGYNLDVYGVWSTMDAFLILQNPLGSFIDIDDEISDVASIMLQNTILDLLEDGWSVVAVHDALGFLESIVVSETVVSVLDLHQTVLVGQAESVCGYVLEAYGAWAVMELSLVVWDSFGNHIVLDDIPYDVSLLFWNLIDELLEMGWTANYDVTVWMNGFDYSDLQQYGFCPINCRTTTSRSLGSTHLSSTSTNCPVAWSETEYTCVACGKIEVRRNYSFNGEPHSWFTNFEFRVLCSKCFRIRD